MSKQIETPASTVTHHLVMTQNLKNYTVYTVQLDNGTSETFDGYDDAHNFVLDILYGIGGKWRASEQRESMTLHKYTWDYIG